MSKLETKQEIFTAVKNHLLKQNEQAVGKDGGCKYRIKKGTRTLKCAAGGLILKRYYSPNFENSGAGSAPVRNALSLSGVSTTQSNLQLLHRLQRIHDLKPVSDWPKELENLAANESLDFEA